MFTSRIERCGAGVTFPAFMGERIYMLEFTCRRRAFRPRCRAVAVHGGRHVGRRFGRWADVPDGG